MTDNAKPAFVGTSEAPCSARHTIEQNPHAVGPTWRINRPNRWGDKETFAYAWKQVDAQMIADALNAQNAPHQARRGSGVALDAVVGLPEDNR